MSDTHHVVVAQCTDSKRDKSSPAGEMYDESRYFRKQRAYARTADQWFIQSAKHGLLHPETVIEDYDKRPKDIDDVDAWAESIADDIEERVPADAEIELLGGMAYTDPLTPALEVRGFEVHEPLRGQGIGTRQSTLDDMKTEVSHASLLG